MNILIIKLNATGDVVRTTPLLRRLPGEIIWITAQNNLVLLHQLAENLTAVSWEDRESVRGVEYDLVINLEDDTDVAGFVQQVRYKQLFGAYMNGQATPGTVNGNTDGTSPQFGVISQITLNTGSQGINYNFAEEIAD